ncbi:hypothetical protein [Deinococcus sp. YIM 77859]|uniref:hypothetical protein n=1 Tax=Deinococcus sp. YIM 77859 TaxID=1540221 RepID=UPI000A7A43E1|nr:hypothetical protein [Deinococcus sp. YIM 77859]
MTNPQDGTGNEAEQMQEGYIEQQERWRETGKTSAGGAGQTSTPGNDETGAALPEESSGTPPPLPDDQHTPGR